MGRPRKIKTPAARVKRGRGRPKKTVEKIDESNADNALTANSSNALALVPVTTSRRHENAEHTRIVHSIHSPKEPEEIREPTAGFVLAAVDGFLYEGDKDEEACPQCANRLMWYWMPDEKEILCCANSVCDYPFDDTSELRVRTRDHSKRVIAGNPPDVDTGAAANTLNEKDLRVNEPGLRCYVPLDSRYGQEFVDDYLNRFMSTPKELRKPEVVDTGFIDHDSIRGTMACLKALETAPIPD